MNPAVKAAAHATHEANRAWCRAHSDDSQLPWDSAPEWQKESAIKGIEQIIKNPNITPEQLHQCWCETKHADGWMWGAVKDPAKKQHPCLVRYDQLPPEQKAKDEIFQRVARAMLKAFSLPDLSDLGYKIPE